MINFWNKTKKLFKFLIFVFKGKKKYLIDQFGENACNLMKLLKKSMDPNNILNPGKIF